MKLVINMPLVYTSEYNKEYTEDSIPNVGDDFDKTYYVKNKTVENGVCTLDLGFKSERESEKS